MKTQPHTPRSKLTTDVQRALDVIEQTVAGFDRITLWVDHPAPHVPVSKIKRCCADLKVNEGSSLLFHPVWQTKIELFQPSCGALSALDEALGTRHRTRLSYTELAIDWLVGNRTAAYTVRNFLLAHMYVPYFCHDVAFMGTTAYFAPRTESSWAKRARNITLYDDYLSKLWAVRQLHSPCCHLEYRLQGVGTLADYGLLTLSDSIQFNHHAFWRTHLRLHCLPKMVELGRWLDPDRANVSDAALRKRANLFLDQYRHNGTLVLQDCRREHPEIDDMLLPLSNAWFLPT